MAKLKLGETARRAVRKLFGRDHDQSTTAATSASSNTLSKDDTNTVDNTTGPDDSSRITADIPVDIQTTAAQQTKTISPDTPALPVVVEVPPGAPVSEASENAPPVTPHLEEETDSKSAQEAAANNAMRTQVSSSNENHAQQSANMTDKENLPLGAAPEKQKHPNQVSAGDVGILASGVDKLDLEDTPTIKVLHAESPVIPAVVSNDEIAVPNLSPEELKALQAEQDRHAFFTEEALEMARLALRTNETPVGCVFVHNDKIIARGMNATNVTRNGTRHAEFMALAALLSFSPSDGPRTTSLKPKMEAKDDMSEDAFSAYSVSPDEGNEDGRKGHLYPYGQKEHPDARVDRSIIRECVLYVTVEPCVMCASLLRQLGIKKVYFGAVNDKFGGTGGVFSIHANSLPVSSEGPSMSAHPQPPPVRLPGGRQVLGTSFPPSGGDGGDVEPGYEIEGGWGRDDAVGLLRKFYVQENGRAPVPRKKEGRAARLAALENEANENESIGNTDNASVDLGSIDVGLRQDEDPEMALKNGTNELDQDEEKLAAEDSKIDI